MTTFYTLDHFFALKLNLENPKLFSFSILYSQHLLFSVLALVDLTIYRPENKGKLQITKFSCSLI